MTHDLLDPEEIKRLRAQLDNPPDLDSMVAAGMLTQAGAGWYEPKTEEAKKAIGPFVTGVKTGRDGRAVFKVPRPRKSKPAPGGGT